MLMINYPYNVTETNKFDLGKRVNHLFEQFPDLFSICLEVQHRHTFKKGKCSKKQIIIDISKAVVRDNYNNLIDWTEKNHLPENNSNAVFYFILNFFYKKNFQLISLDGTYFDWGDLKNYFNESSFFQEEFFQYFYEEQHSEQQHLKFIFSRNCLEHDIKQFYGQYLNSKKSYNHFSEMVLIYPQSDSIYLFKI